MSPLRHACANHPGRDASIRCFHCRNFFCRECASRYRNRLVCSACLRHLREETEPGRPKRKIPLAWLGAVAGSLVLWTAFYCLGRVLIELPSSFHEGTVWKELVE